MTKKKMITSVSALLFMTTMAISYSRAGAAPRTGSTTTTTLYSLRFAGSWGL
jgi:hypothetical protein